MTPRGPIRLTANPPKVASPEPAANTSDVKARYVGSVACQRCHAATYERWSHTRMANVITDPKANPRVVLGDFSKPNPLVTFKLEDVAFTYGTKWKQRYFLRSGNDYYPASAQWDVINGMWRTYHVQPNTEWWVPHYPAKPGDNSTRPTGPLCDGCHSTNYDVQTKRVTEWNVGCERCHGPGSEHVARPSKATIIDPSRLNYVAANDMCLQCHTQGRPTKNPHNGQYYDWPVGFHVGLELKDFWTLEEHHLGETTFTHYAEGTAKKNRMQANDFVDSLDVSTKGVDLFQLPRRARHESQRRSRQAAAANVPDVPRPEFTERPAGADGRGAHTPCGGQRGQSVRRMPHAENRADHRERQRPQPQLQVHHAVDVRAVQDSQPVHDVSHVADDRMGKGSVEELVGCVSVESAVGEETRACGRVVAACGHTRVLTDEMHDRL